MASPLPSGASEVAFLISMAKEELPATKAADEDDEEETSAVSVALTFRTTRGDGFMSSRNSDAQAVAPVVVIELLPVVLVALALAATRTAEADFGAREGRLRVGLIGGAAVEVGGTFDCAARGCAAILPLVPATLLVLLFKVGGSLRATGGEGFLLAANGSLPDLTVGAFAFPDGCCWCCGFC